MTNSVTPNLFNIPNTFFYHLNFRRGSWILELQNDDFPDMSDEISEYFDTYHKTTVSYSGENMKF